MRSNRSLPHHKTLETSSGNHTVVSDPNQLLEVNQKQHELHQQQQQRRRSSIHQSVSHNATASAAQGQPVNSKQASQNQLEKQLLEQDSQHVNSMTTDITENKP